MNEEAVPPAEVEVAIVEDVPVVGHGIVGVAVTVALIKGVLTPTVVVRGTGAIGLIVIKVGPGLRPPDPSSVEPIGIPSRPTAMEAIPVGDDDDAAGWPSEALAVPDEHAPDAVPARPPPSKVDIKVDVPVLDVPAPVELPAMELPIEVPAVLPMVPAVPMEVPTVPTPMEAPVVALPVPVPVPDAALKVERPKDACAIEPPKPEHAVMVPVGASGDAPDARGLVPRVAIEVAPNGIPVGATGEADPMPSGDVMPTAGVGLPPIWANTGLLPKSVAAIATINERLIIVSI